MLLIIMKNNEVELKPILKWVGGKRQILDKIIPLIPPSFNSYFEPFAGGLALCLALKPHKAYINDLNNSYKFNDNEQIRLKEVCDYLTKRNIRFLLSNSNIEFIRKLYKDYKIIEIETKRSINSKGNHRTGFKEFLIRNY